MRVSVPEVILPAEELGRVHLVGIGGAGLSGIARLLLARGVKVSGSDGADSPTLERLRALGARVHLGHDAAHVRDVDTVVVSTAIGTDNPEYREARVQGLRVLPRSAALAALMVGRRVVSVAGTHGKTTTTSLLTVALQAAGVDPTYAVGGDLAHSGTNAAVGAGDLFVVEADESDGAFLVYPTAVGVVTNVEADHLDVWGTPQAYAAAFDQFADAIAPDGFLVACLDDPGAASLVARQRAAGRRVVSVGASEGADLRLSDLTVDATGSRCSVSWPGVGGRRVVRTLELSITGLHFLLDAALALAVCVELGLPLPAVFKGLAGFTGTRRRMETKGEAGGVRVVDSYAHHPTEIAADLQAARAVAGAGRVLVAFQPHLVSRTRLLAAGMGRALGAADEVVLTDVYLAREAADPQVSGALVAAAVPLPAERVVYVPDLDGVAAELVARAVPGDLVLTLGAGSITELAPLVLDLLEGVVSRG